jgi:hypothetical protein
MEFLTDQYPHNLIMDPDPKGKLNIDQSIKVFLTPIIVSKLSQI